MNKVTSRCQKESSAKFYYASRVMQFESKFVKLIAYAISIIPIVLSFLPIPGDKEALVFATTMISFGLAILLEFLSTFLSNHKEKSILLGQLYETEISGTTFSKIEYDRETTNELNELAIRRSAIKMAKLTEYHKENVPETIEDKYSYLYLCRIKSAKINYLMSRMYAIYIAILTFLVVAFTSIAFVKNDTFQFLQLIIQFYPLVLPIIRNITSSRKTMRYCAKLSADIDNFFADGDDSTMRLARFVYYVQNIEFEMLMASPARYVIFYKLFHRGLKTLQNGVTKRFVAAEKGLYKLAGKHIPKELTKPEKREVKTAKKAIEHKNQTIKQPAKPKKEEKSSSKSKSEGSSTGSKQKSVKVDIKSKSAIKTEKSSTKTDKAKTVKAPENSKKVIKSKK